MPALTITIVLLTGLGGGGAAQALPLAPALLANAAISAIPIAPARWRYRYRSRYGNSDYDDQRSVLWRRDGETSGAGSLIVPFLRTVPAERQRRGRWVDPPPPQQ